MAVSAPLDGGVSCGLDVLSRPASVLGVLLPIRREGMSLAAASPAVFGAAGEPGADGYEDTIYD